MLRTTSLLILLFTLLTAATCNSTSQQPTALRAGCFKGKLVIKGICMNYVIQVLQGDTSGLQMEKTWVDETSDKTYNQVFALASKCSFPDMEEGAEFYFTVTGKDEKECNVCLAYRDVPIARNNIVVSKTPCTQ